MMTRAIRIHRHGGPEVMQLEEVELPEPDAGQVRVKNTCIGVNYADIYEREGDHGGPHFAKEMPITMGHMAVGIIDALGAGVTDRHIGERVGYIGPNSYAGHTNIPVARLFRLPDAVPDTVAGGYLLRGLTAEYLLRRLYKVQPGTTALVHAAAGGMGLILGQWGSLLGARMIGTVSSPQKAQVARAHGYDTVINYSSEDFAERTLAETNGVGADVIYDGVGKMAFLKSLDCIRPRGMVVSYGTASGNVGEFDLQRLHSKSIVVTRPTLRSWIADPDEAATASKALFDVLSGGKLHTPIGAQLPLDQAAAAHHQLASRSVTAPIVLIP
ncbi:MULTISPECIES: quinone oxidoreductase family protein [Roseobacteraceae]|uniref:2-haloacrylate reductase n=1 Tax=Pseudosulfitobacter pseudonitzschiae TaxID=1402135 RepID=A0A221JX55_9RHOB|nr:MULTISPECIES: quinone oxidoreductase [Roseobacteraceae]ASM71331.1 2-haloacrylate reductase [Pseudosulfitobacter pseudonitzschiae]